MLSPVFVYVFWIGLLVFMSCVNHNTKKYNMESVNVTNLNFLVWCCMTPYKNTQE